MVQNNIHDKIANEYFEWMYHLVCNEGYYNKTRYRKLLYLLHSIDFFPIIPMDDNRRIDGIDFRYRFGIENGYSDDYIKENLDLKQCSIFEMMVALSFNIEDNITCNNEYGNRTGQWFWSMIVSLGLGGMDDTKFDKEYCLNIIDIFLGRRYQSNGAGGLFTLVSPPADMRQIDIWCQCMWYLNEVFIE